VLWGRAVLQTIFVGLTFAVRRESPWGPRAMRGLLCLRGLLGVLSIVGYFIGIIALPLSFSISLYSVKPIFAALLGACLLREALGCRHIAATGIALLGCILVARDKEGSAQEGGFSTSFASVVVVLAALGAAATSVVTRRIMSKSTLRPEVPVWYFCVADLILLVVLTPFLGKSTLSHRTAELGVGHVIAVVGVAGFSVLGQQWMTLGLRHIPSALGTLLVQTETLHAFILQAIFYGKVSVQSIVGALLISLATISLAASELWPRDAENNCHQAVPTPPKENAASSRAGPRVEESTPLGP